MRGRLAGVLAGFLAALPAVAGGRPVVEVDFELDANRFSEAGPTCRAEVESAVETCAHHQDGTSCAGSPDSTPGWWNELSFVDFRGGAGAAVWKLTLGCADKNAGTDVKCPIGLRPNLDGRDARSFYPMFDADFSPVDSCYRTPEGGCECGELVDRLFARLPELIEERQTELAGFFGENLSIEAKALPVPNSGREAWILSLSREELSTGPFSVYEIEPLGSNLVCRSRDEPGAAEADLPPEWRGKIFAKVLRSDKGGLGVLDQQCLDHLSGLQPLVPADVRLKVLCFVHPGESLVPAATKILESGMRCN